MMQRIEQVETSGSEASPRRAPLPPLGRKGEQTRRRLLDAALALLEGGSAVGLTTSAITTAAGMSAANFYNYFEDVSAILYTLSLEATERSAAILQAIEPRGADDNVAAIAERFVNAYRDLWTENRAILCIRNMEADRGNTQFLFIRRAFADRMTKGLVEVSQRFRRWPMPHVEHGLNARLAVIIAAIERLAAVELLYGHDETYPPIPVSALREAEIAILAAILDPQIVFERRMDHNGAAPEADLASGRAAGGA